MGDGVKTIIESMEAEKEALEEYDKDFDDAYSTYTQEKLPQDKNKAAERVKDLTAKKHEGTEAIATLAEDLKSTAQDETDLNTLEKGETDLQTLIDSMKTWKPSNKDLLDRMKASKEAITERIQSLKVEESDGSSIASSKIGRVTVE